jgi:hypothetical protein
MRRQVAIVRAERAQAIADQAKMFRLLEGHLHPAVEEGMRHVLRREAGDDVERKIDRVEFNMGERVEEGDAALLGMQRTFFHMLRRDQRGFFRPAGTGRQRRIQRRTHRKRAGKPAPRGLLRQFRLHVEIGGADSRRRPAAKAFDVWNFNHSSALYRYAKVSWRLREPHRHGR